MSSMLGSPPPSIQIGGGGSPGAPGGNSGPGAGGPGDGPDSDAVKALIQEAISKLDQAKGLEGDPGDQALIAKCVADLHGFIGNQQKMLDTAMGAGPGVKIMRKSAPPSGGGGGGASPYGG